MKKIAIIMILSSIYGYNLFVNSTKVNETVSFEESVVVNKQIIKNEKTEKLNSYDLNNNNHIDLVNFEEIRINDNLDKVLSLVGKPQRIDKCEYDFNWYVYNSDYNKFFMIGIKNEKVVALFSNSLNSIELEDINLGQTRKEILKNYKPLEYKVKDNTKYKIDSKEEYDVLKLNNKYITLFYDIHNNNSIKSYQIIEKYTENNNDEIYPQNNEIIIKDLELQMIDLINSERVKNNLEALLYSKESSESSKKHSLDMLQNNFFDHINKNGESPFDRMKKENINYIYAGENIAAGQTSSIFAHEALMNSLGHRKNILGNNYKYVGIGIKIGGSYTTYFTQNYYK